MVIAGLAVKIKRRFILFPALLAVIAFCGCQKQEHVPITPQTPPTADFTYDVANHVTRLVEFTNTSTYAESYSWTFGDAATSTLASPQHNYPSYGNYNVTLTATGQGGTNTATKTVTITP